MSDIQLEKNKHTQVAKNYINELTFFRTTKMKNNTFYQYSHSNVKLHGGRDNVVSLTGVTPVLKKSNISYYQ